MTYPMNGPLPFSNNGSLYGASTGVNASPYAGVQNTAQGLNMAGSASGYPTALGTSLSGESGVSPLMSVGGVNATGAGSGISAMMNPLMQRIGANPMVQNMVQAGKQMGQGASAAFGQIGDFVKSNPALAAGMGGGMAAMMGACPYASAIGATTLATMGAAKMPSQHPNVA